MDIESSVQSSLLNMLESTENRPASNEPQTNDASSDALHPVISISDAHFHLKSYFLFKRAIILYSMLSKSFSRNSDESQWKIGRSKAGL